MNSRHSKLTDWGLSHIAMRPQNWVLDVGCGGGRTISKLAAIATTGKVVGVDFSDISVSVAKKLNARAIALGRVEIHEASVAELPFEANTFDLVTAIETHFWWPDLAAGLREVFRTLKPGATLVVIAEIYKGADTKVARMAEKVIPLSGMNLLSPDEHHAILAETGYIDVRVFTEATKGWICAMGTKPLA